MIIVMFKQHYVPFYDFIFILFIILRELLLNTVSTSTFPFYVFNNMHIKTNIESVQFEPIAIPFSNVLILSYTIIIDDGSIDAIM